MRDQDAGAAGGNEAAHEVEKLARDDRIERGRRLIQDDELHRNIGHREGASDLDHLPACDREIADNVAGLDAVGRKNLVELADDQIARSLAPSPAPEAAVKDMRILGHRQIGTER